MAKHTAVKHASHCSEPGSSASIPSLSHTVSGRVTKSRAPSVRAASTHAVNDAQVAHDEVEKDPGFSAHSKGNSKGFSSKHASRRSRPRSALPSANISKAASGRVKKPRAPCMRAPSTGGVGGVGSRRLYKFKADPHSPDHMRHWAGVWSSYMEASHRAKSLDQLVWPVLGHRIEDVRLETVRSFYNNCSRPGFAFLMVLKDELHRWHSSSVVQRWGPLPKHVMERITEVYLVLQEYYYVLTNQWITHTGDLVRLGEDDELLHLGEDY